MVFKKGHNTWNKGKQGEYKLKHSPDYNNRKLSLSKIGINNPNWKGGKTKHLGYIKILNKNHPLADQEGYVREHRLVMEQFISNILERPYFLNSNHEVHHINRIKTDNRIGNLLLFKSNSSHRTFHIKFNRLKNRMGGVI